MIAMCWLWWWCDVDDDDDDIACVYLLQSQSQPASQARTHTHTHKDLEMCVCWFFFSNYFSVRRLLELCDFGAERFIASTTVVMVVEGAAPSSEIPVVLLVFECVDQPRDMRK